MFEAARWNDELKYTSALAWFVVGGVVGLVIDYLFLRKIAQAVGCFFSGLLWMLSEVRIMKLYTIREVLENIIQMPDSWFYLPPINWELETKGAFSLNGWEFAPDSTDHLPPQVISEGWREALDKASIEYVISNLDQQRSDATTEDYFNALKFYCEYDTFVVI